VDPEPSVIGFLLLYVVISALGPAAGPQGQAVSPSVRIDELVEAGLAAAGVPPAPICDDATFLRRAFLDLTGTLPTAAEARAFLADRAPDRRARLVDELLARPAFADYWAMRWSDILRVKAEFPINLWPNGAQAYHHWIRQAIATDLPFDAFARRLLTSSGSCYREPAVNFLRAVEGHEPEVLAEAAALAFLGARTSTWTQEQRVQFSVFFSRVGFKATREWKEEIVFTDFARPGPQTATLPDGSVVRIAPDEDPRVVLADWLMHPDNSRFGRVAANRVWAWLFGRGIVHEPDDFRPDNPPANPELLDFLAAEYARCGWDRKQLIGVVTGTRAWQRSAVPSGDPELSARLFGSYSIRPLGALVLPDALYQISATTESHTSAVPSPYTWEPREVRAVQIPDGTITSPFLEMFGRPSRDTGLESARSREPTPEQRLHLLNSTHVLNKLKRGPGMRALLRGRQPQRVLDELFLTFLSRFPTPAERRRVQAYVGSDIAPPRAAVVDVAWSLLNSSEFLYRH